MMKILTQQISQIFIGFGRIGYCFLKEQQKESAKKNDLFINDNVNMSSNILHIRPCTGPIFSHLFPI